MWACTYVSIYLINLPVHVPTCLLFIFLVSIYLPIDLSIYEYSDAYKFAQMHINIYYMYLNLYCNRLFDFAATKERRQVK